MKRKTPRTFDRGGMGRINPWTRRPKYSKNHVVFFHVAHNEMVIGSRVCFLAKTLVKAR